MRVVTKSSHHKKIDYLYVSVGIDPQLYLFLPKVGLNPNMLDLNGRALLSEE